ncbi:uncharacterized protein LOC135484079 isoform X1 [Lineus longissimus]|uniref:uncharacterized protein LOC135484079 isoform X1 n=1 Tax=Lineus longissimus TaxID=88925 RepID=UPI002B4DC66A
MASQNLGENMGGKLKIGILTVSDSCYEKKADDRSGPNLKRLIEEKNLIPGTVVLTDIVPDEKDQIKAMLIDWCDTQHIELILTTGGTGFSPRDVTPEATRSVIEKEAPGLTITMIQKSLEVTPLAALSRPVCGSRGRTLIINFPGSKKGSEECLTFVAGVLPHAVDLLHDRKANVSSVHKVLQEEQGGRQETLHQIDDKPETSAPEGVLLPSMSDRGALAGKTTTSGLEITSPYDVCGLVYDGTTARDEAQQDTVYVIIDTENEQRAVAAVDRSSVYNFEDLQNDILREAEEKSVAKSVTKPNTRSRNKPVGDGGEICFVKTGPHLKPFLNSHPILRNLYLNRGKRDVKKHLVAPRHLETAVDTGSWQRGKNVHQRNRLDDVFVYTEEGLARSKLVKTENQRDEYVVNWYLWCPGHGNCQRSCGGFGKCEPGCKGKAHRQDRHNCSVVINLKIFLSDLTQWRVHISGNHVPIDSKILWQPPLAETQRIDEDLKDVILAKLHQSDAASEVHSHIEKKRGTSLPTPSKRKVSYFMSHLKKRRSERSYEFSADDLKKALEKESGDDREEQSDTVPTGSQSSVEVPSEAGSVSLQYDPGKETVMVIQHAGTSGVPVVTYEACNQVDKNVRFMEYTDSGHNTYNITQVDENKSAPVTSASETQVTLPATPHNFVEATNSAPLTGHVATPTTETVLRTEETASVSYYSVSGSVPGVPGAQLMEKAARDMNLQLMKLK